MLRVHARVRGAGRRERSGQPVRERASNVSADACRAEVTRAGLAPVDKYLAFIDVLERDARSALAAVQLAMAQPSISSQLIDNLNASIHVRALLTDLFLIDEILKTHARVG